MLPGKKPQTRMSTSQQNALLTNLLNHKLHTPEYLVCPRQGLTWLYFPLLWHFQIGESTREEEAQVLDSPAPSLTMFLMLKKISLATAQQDQSKQHVRYGLS